MSAIEQPLPSPEEPLPVAPTLYIVDTAENSEGDLQPSELSTFEPNTNPDEIIHAVATENYEQQAVTRQERARARRLARMATGMGTPQERNFEWDDRKTLAHALLSDAQSDDPEQAREAFGKIYKLTHGSIRDFVYKFTGDGEAAGDIVHEIYCKAQKGIGNFHGEANIHTWLWQIAINSSKTWHKKQSRPTNKAVSIDSPEVQHNSDTLNTTIDYELLENQELLVKYLEELPNKYGTAVVLFYICDLPYRQIGERMGISENAAKVNAYRGIKRLKELMYDENPDDML